MTCYDMPILAPMSSSPSFQHHATKAAKRREADRLRKREARARMKEDRVPHASLVDYAISQAASFCLVNADKSVWRKADGWFPINGASIIEIAIDVLAIRFGKDREKSEEAVRAKLGRQDGHSISGMIPSTNPAHGQPRYVLTAPKDVSTEILPAGPLPLQDRSGAGQGAQH